MLSLRARKLSWAVHSIFLKVLYFRLQCDAWFYNPFHTLVFTKVYNKRAPANAERASNRNDFRNPKGLDEEYFRCFFRAVYERYRFRAVSSDAPSSLLRVAGYLFTGCVCDSGQYVAGRAQRGSCRFLLSLCIGTHVRRADGDVRP